MKILVGIPLHNPTEGFRRDSAKLLQDASGKYFLKEKVVVGKSLVDAQNEIKDALLEGDYTHLLFLEDDHEGHTLAMLDELVSMDTDIAAVCYQSRWAGFPKTAMVKSGKPAPREYRQIAAQEGIHEVDLCGFGFTLIKRKVLEAVGKFVTNDDNPRNVATDKRFCERAKELGFTIKSTLNHNLLHRGLGKHNLMINLERWLTRRRRGLCYAG